MKEGTDYGKIPGTGDRKTLLQPGAQKLLMTFNLQEEVKKETLREYPGMHREYEFTITVIAPNGKRWDGVGTCSTLESKYRYRKAERKCPNCGKAAIIKGKDEYGGGWVCFKKKDGCGAKFADDERAIVSQGGGVVENEDPADVWNTVRKMAFKRGLVAAAINATNTSELWTQDMEDMGQNEEVQKEKTLAQQIRKSENNAQNAPGRSGGVSTGTPQAQSSGNVAKPNASVVNKPSGEVKPWPQTPKTREWLLSVKLANQSDLALDYFRKAGILLPNEELKDLGLQWLPMNPEDMAKLAKALTAFGSGAEAQKPYASRPLPGEVPRGKPATSATTPAQSLEQNQAPPPAEPRQNAARVVAADKADRRDPEWWRDVIVPVPHKGQKRSDYITNPDTIGSLYDQMKSGNEASGKRLWGFVSHYEAKPWVGNDKVARPASDVDKAFRAALDAFADWDDRHGNNTDPTDPLSDPVEAQQRNEESTPFD
jgi:hypothetical protein